MSEMLSRLATLVTIRHRCDCEAATEAPGEDGTEHVLQINGEDFPWCIDKVGPVVTMRDGGLCTVWVGIVAERVDAVGVPIHEMGGHHDVSD